MFPLRRKARVLVLDDDESMQRLVSTLLKREGYRVTGVDNGLQAIDALKKTKFDVILLDLMMPTEGGMTVIRHLRAHDPAVLERVIVLTATADAVLRTIENDVFAIVRKPFEATALIEAVKRLTRR
jgi:CheY-like chemotaxis protein